MRGRRQGQGFTLLELIIVVLVIGILASIALPRYIRIAEKGRIAEAKSLLGEMRAAQLRYSASKGTFTGTTADFDTTFSTPRYFTLTVLASGGANLSADTTLVATATRNTLDNPNMGSYQLNITQAGNITVGANTTPFGDLL